MTNYNEQLSFQHSSDTGTAEAASIVPIADEEAVWSGATNRPIENLRYRTEILRRAVQDARYYQDYDRGLILRSEGRFQLTEPVAGTYVLSATDDIWVYPSLTPGRSCGGRWQGGRVFFGENPYLGVLNAGLVLTASTASTGQRGYYDGDTMATSTVLSVGANRIVVDLVADPAQTTGTFVYLVTQTPATKITIRYGSMSGAPSHAALIASLNANPTVNVLLFASSTAASPGSVYISQYTGAVVQGAYDAEAHCVTFSQMGAFFTATVSGEFINRLRDGEGLAIGYPVGPVQTFTVPYPSGGRRQSIFDLPTNRSGLRTENVTPVSSYSLFNTGREPEKIAGAVPLGKLVRILIAPSTYITEFVFIDGTRVRLGDASIGLGESAGTYRALASRTGVTGASLVGYGGSGNWNPNSIVSPVALPPSTVEEALDSVVSQLGGYASTVGGARRVGFEELSGVSSEGNVGPLALNGTYDGVPVRSVQVALSKAVNQTAAHGVMGGLNSRVSEYGHRMHGPAPIEKIFSDADIDTGGAQLVRAVLNIAPNARVGAQIEEQAYLSLQPFYWKNFNSTIELPASLFVDPSAGLALDRVDFDTSYTSNQLKVLIDELALTVGLRTRLHCVVRLSATGDAATDGFYFATWIDMAPTPWQVELRSLAGAVVDVSGIAGKSRLEFFRTTIVGNDAYGNQGRNTVGAHFSGAAAAYYGNGAIKRGYDLEGVERHSETVNRAVWKDQTTLLSLTTGVGASSTVGATGSQNRLRITGLAGMTTQYVGRWLYITAASNTLLLGLWKIIAYVNATTVDISIPHPTLTAVTGITWGAYPDASRISDNILVTEDAAYLRGVELGAPVDATANHHHGSSYSRFLPIFISPAAFTWDTISSSPGTQLTLATPAAGRRHVGVVFQYVLTLSATAAPGLTSLVFSFRDAGGAIYYATEHYYTSTGGDTHVFTSPQLTIPLVNNKLQVSRDFGTNVVLVGCLLQIKVIAVFEDFV